MKYKIFFLSLLVLVFSFSGVYALQDGMCVTSEITSINPSSVEPDEDFTVGILIDNCGTELPEDIVFEITSHSKDISIKESLVQEIGEMGYANSQRFIVYNMRTSKDITPGKHFFETELRYGDDIHSIEKESNFSITAINQEPDLTISRIYTNPEITYTNEKSTLIIDVENAGNGEAKDVRINIEDFDLDGAKLNYLGKINPDENVPARFIIEPEEPGIYEGNINLSYEFAGETRYLDFPFEIQVFEETNNLFIYIGLVLVVILGYFFAKKYLKNE